MLSIQSLDALVTPSVVQIFDESQQQISAEGLQYSKFGYVDYEPSFDSPSFQNISGVSEAVLTLEGTPYAPEDVIQNYKVSAQLKKYTKLIKITEETVHWIQKGNKERAQQFRDTVQACNNSLNQKIDIEAAKLFYLGFGTTFQTGGDGKALLASDHPSPDTSVTAQRNVPPTANGHELLTREALTRGVQNMNRFYDIKGVQLMRCRKFKVIIARENEENLKAILMSTQGPLTANLGINPMATQYSRVEYEVADYIPVAYASYWFLLDMERASRALYMLWGWKPKINNESEYSSGTLYKAGSVYFKPVFIDWRFIYGSKGDQSAS